MSKLEALLRLLVELVDDAVFLWLAIRGAMYVWEGTGGYVPFWGCAMISTAVFWKKLDKGAIISSLKDALCRFKVQK